MASHATAHLASRTDNVKPISMTAPAVHVYLGHAVMVLIRTHALVSLVLLEQIVMRTLTTVLKVVAKMEEPVLMATMTSLAPVLKGLLASIVTCPQTVH